MHPVRFLLFFALIINLVSCATILSGSTEKINLFSTSADTKVYANDVFLGQAGPESPLTITIPKKGAILFRGIKEGCTQGESQVQRSIDPTTFLGFLIDWGIVSIFFVDYIGTNAMFRSSQSSYLIPVRCDQ